MCRGKQDVICYAPYLVVMTILAKIWTQFYLSHKCMYVYVTIETECCALQSQPRMLNLAPFCCKYTSLHPTVISVWI